MQELLGGRKISPLAEPEFHRVAVPVDRTVQIPPLASHLDIDLVGMPFAGDGPLAPVELLQ